MHACVIHSSIHPSIHPSIRTSIHPFIYPFIYDLSSYISICLLVYTSIYLPSPQVNRSFLSRTTPDATQDLATHFRIWCVHLVRSGLLMNPCF
jgi:hypothetical protein